MGGRQRIRANQQCVVCVASPRTAGAVRCRGRHGAFPVVRVSVHVAVKGTPRNVQPPFCTLAYNASREVTGTGGGRWGGEPT